jgi:hypothetical protein
LAIQKQLEKDDSVVLKTVQSQSISESMKKTITDWFSSCLIPEDEMVDAVEPAQKKVKVEK